ncbi:galactose-3-O-sulfotransferase 4 isoform X2 [Dermacentor silvarum]|uniref:galactose-3-O-sulfotransferase 4 isoform X2 n=1 Tax=Dermacentor silvarum TaxID=543639 RepID=UPI002101AFA5|nr:galactose-3-O-sulfotransferase 4 isoform X2 [Dermacentor silvarum]
MAPVALLRLAGLLHRRRLALLAASTLLLLGFVTKPGLKTGLRSLSLPGGKMLRCFTEEHSGVCFVKTHKCASSSVQNMLMRYGESHGLRFVLPKTKNYLGHPRLFNRSMAPGRPPFDMLVHHARFHEAEMRAVLRRRPHFVTIVREPATLFESLYSYYGLKRKTNMSLRQFATAALVDRSVMGLLARTRTRSKLGFNQMSFDLGLEPAQFGNTSAVRRFIKELDATFDLVMVAERMNESLVLLKDLFCWDTDDVVVFKLNARQSAFRSPLSPQLASQVRSLNAADVQLYEHFARRFDLRVRQFGQKRMAKELHMLQERTRYWYERCVKYATPPDKSRPTAEQTFWINPKVLVFRAKNESSEECVRMTLPELVYTERLRQKQFGNTVARR